MYGLVNKAIQDMICKYHGEDTWETIKQKAALEDIDFLLVWMVILTMLPIA